MTKQKKFEATKQDFIERCKDNGACQGEFKRVVNSSTEDELLKVIYDNLSWCITKKILDQKFLERFTPEALLKSGIANTGKENSGLANSGDSNSGYSNSGDRNSGDSNSGDRNSGDSNSGYSNSGDWNSGDRNSGDSNSGYRNSGYRNSGAWNSGDSNSGDSNSGAWNSGDRNSGDSNSGYRNSGAFCTDPNPIVWLFDKPTNITVKEWEKNPVLNIMTSIDPTIWVPSSVMSDEDKVAHPKHETTGGYLKSITLHEAWANMWFNLSDDKKKLFTDLPNFDAEKFKVITGIKI